MTHASLRWVLLLSGICFLLPACSGQLTVGFYTTTCPNLTAIATSRIDRILASNIGMAAGFLRLHFHDCFVRGCDGSVLINSTNGNLAEKDSTPNVNSLIGFSEIDAIKADVEAACPGVVSCADIIALAAEIATSKVGVVTWPVPLGRRDGIVSIAAEAVTSLPSPGLSFGQLVQAFAVLGLDSKDMIVLSGAHTIGRTRCQHVNQRLWNFGGVFNRTDPAIDPTFVDFFKARCPFNSAGSFITLDSTAQNFDDTYYTNVLALRGILASDAELLNNPVGVQTINVMLSSNSFGVDFSASMVKMGSIQVLTGTQGEIRRNCAVIN